MTTAYYDAIQLIERLHRRFLEVLKVELDRKGIQDINNVQAMILYNIGDDDLTVGELTARGYYLGSNVSYNVKKMVENGYLDQERSKHDKRSIRVKLSEKGKDLCSVITEMFVRHQEVMAGTDLEPAIENIDEALKLLDRFWTSQAGFGGLTS